MKRMIALFAALACALALAGCTNDFTIEDLLTAPALTADQSSVLAAIDAYSEEKTVLKYPTSGERRAPIQFVDLDGDIVNEAVVFFSVPSEDVYAKLAVMKKIEGEWRIASVINGSGTDVETISIIRLEDNTGRFLLVEWSSTNSSEHQLTAYHFCDGELSLGFEEACSDILVYDMDGDGGREFVYITPGSTFEPFRIKYVDNTEKNVLAEVGECELGSDMISSVALSAGTLLDGRQAVFVDENIGDMQTTEVFLLGEDGLVPVELDEGYDIAEIAVRSLDKLTCQSVFGGSRTYIPSEQPPTEEIRQPNKWTYWYSIRGGKIVYAGATYIVEDYGIALTVPDAWLATVTVANNAVEKRTVELLDGETNEVRLRLKILEIGEDAAAYIEEGYSLITQSGSYRYYIKLYGAQDDLSFIKSNFSVL